MAKRILIRRDTTANWNNVNPILSNGELGIEIKTDGNRSMKLGTGSIAWNSLPYFLDNPASLEELENHINNTAAHNATAIPSPGLIAMYNSDGGLKSDRGPIEQNDVLRKTELDTVNNNISGILYDIDSLDNEISGIYYDIETETLNRISAISGVQYELDTEINHRISGDTWLYNDLNTEITNRITAISGVQYDIITVESDLANEILDRISGNIWIQNEINEITTDFNTEINNLYSDVSGLGVEVDTLETDLNTEINNRIAGISGAIYTASVDATTKANTAENNAKQYVDDLSLATQKWLPAVQTYDELDPDPGDGTYLCRVITGSDYGVYQWIGTEATPAWTFFSDNLDFIDRIANPTTNNLPIITSNGELIDSGESVSGILEIIEDGLDTKEDTISAGTTSQFWRGDKTWQALPAFPAPANSGLLTLQKNAVTIDTFNANASADKTINITISKSDVGLANVDNTSDVNKPISTAVQTALNGKVDNSTLSNYYTETEVNSLLNGKVDNSTLDNYYTETETNTLLSAKEPSKYIAASESAAQTYSTANPTIMVFYPEA